MKQKTPKAGLCLLMSCSFPSPVPGTSWILHKYLLGRWRSALAVPTIQNLSRAFCGWTGPTQGPAAPGWRPVRVSEGVAGMSWVLVLTTTLSGYRWAIVSLPASRRYPFWKEGKASSPHSTPAAGGDWRWAVGSVASLERPATLTAEGEAATLNSLSGLC